jgi:hypothetical protein
MFVPDRVLGESDLAAPSAAEKWWVSNVLTVREDNLPWT